ncbi:MAG: zinc metallopeptidase [Planctomycetes bacterium]|nr:zinc metallopeptidase [Planctomycetota bacterium]
MLTYLWIVVPFVLLSLWASARVRGTFHRFSKVPIRSGFSGLQTARAMLDGAGIRDVAIEAVPGMLSDHYDPSARAVRLSEDILHGRSAAAVAVAAHEVGHAIQHAQGYAPMAWRAQLVPVVQLGSSLAMPMMLAGFLLSIGGLVWLGILGFSLAVLFHLVTLPVEFDASSRAIRVLERSGIVAADEMPGVRKTLFAAGFTYVAAALAAAAQLAYFVLQASGGSRD